MREFLEAIEPMVQATGGKIVAPDAMVDGDLVLSWNGQLVGGFRAPGLHGALDRLTAQVERELGTAITSLDRTGKQEVVRRLDELGAFTLRKAVEDIADRLEVSRFTVYNYLNGLHGRVDR